MVEGLDGDFREAWGAVVLLENDGGAGEGVGAGGGLLVSFAGGEGGAADGDDAFGVGADQAGFVDLG